MSVARNVKQGLWTVRSYGAFALSHVAQFEECVCAGDHLTTTIIEEQTRLRVIHFRFLSFRAVLLSLLVKNTPNNNNSSSQRDGLIHSTKLECCMYSLRCTTVANYEIHLKISNLGRLKGKVRRMQPYAQKQSHQLCSNESKWRRRKTVWTLTFLQQK